MLEKWTDFGEELEMMRRVGIDTLVTDDDDTIRPTGRMIVGIMWQYSQLVADRHGLVVEDVMASLRRHNDRLFGEYFVRPDRWIAASDGVGFDLVGDPMLTRRESELLMSIYDRVPELYPDVMPIMRSLRNHRFKIYVVTHAPLDWAIMKVDQTGLVGVIDGLFAVDVSQAKGVASYAHCLEVTNTKAKKAVGSGDSGRGDILPMIELEFGAVLALPPVWHVTHAEMPARAVPISRYGEFFEGVRRALEQPEV